MPRFRQPAPCATSLPRPRVPRAARHVTAPTPCPCLDVAPSPPRRPARNDPPCWSPPRLPAGSLYRLRIAAVRLIAFLLFVLSLAGTLPAAPPDPGPLHPGPCAGFLPDSIAAQDRLEAGAIALVSADSIQRFARALAAEPHVAGTDAQRRTRDFVIAEMNDCGLRTETSEYHVALPHATTITLEQIAPQQRRFRLREPPLPGDPWSQHEAHVLPQHGFAAPGEASGQLVYVNYALPEDLEQLARLGISLEGRIAIARYGRCYRGDKIARVQRAGAVGCLLYSDPFDDGYFRGDVYPAGPMRPAAGVQRGSVKRVPGDPATPGRPALPDIPRDPPSQWQGLPAIPSLPIGYGVASSLLEALAGPQVPQDWQGALPFRYHVGPGPVAVRIRIEQDLRPRPVWNTFGRIPGSDAPEEWVLLGAHRDAWGCGALDNVSGCAAILEAARVCAALAREHAPPRRSIVFATWDAEEWGLIGSTEWVEQHADTLSRKVIAYVNLDAIAAGPDFHAFATPDLNHLIANLAARVPHPDRAGAMLTAAWQQDGDLRPRIGDAGGGSDHAPLLFLAGVSAAGFGFGGPNGIYHSRYDTPAWMERFGDPGYRRHQAVARLAAVLALRLANADVAPLDYHALAEQVVARTADLQQQLRRDRRWDGLRLDALVESAARLRRAAARVTAWLEPDRLATLSPAQRAALHDTLVSARETLLGEPALPSWSRHALFGTDPDSGYEGIAFPGVTLAVRAGDPPAVQVEIARLVEHLARLAAALESSDLPADPPH